MSIMKQHKQEEPPVVEEDPIIEEAKPEEILNEVVEQALHDRNKVEEDSKKNRPKPKVKTLNRQT